MALSTLTFVTVRAGDTTTVLFVRLEMPKVGPYYDYLYTEYDGHRRHCWIERLWDAAI
jgi:hypothetical protein